MTHCIQGFSVLDVIMSMQREQTFHEDMSQNDKQCGKTQAQNTHAKQKCFPILFSSVFGYPSGRRDIHESFI